MQEGQPHHRNNVSRRAMLHSSACAVAAATFPALPTLATTDKEAVQERRIKEGMGKDAVFFLLGRPARISEGTREGLKYERWIYTDYETVYAHEFGMGMGFGHHGCYYDPFFYGGPQFMSVPVQGATVEFVNGKISGYLVPRR